MVGQCLLLLEADGVDERRPFGLLAIEYGRMLLGRCGHRLGAFLQQPLLDLLGCERRAQVFVESVDDGPRRAGWREQAITQDRIEPGQSRLGNGRKHRAAPWNGATRSPRAQRSIWIPAPRARPEWD